MSVFIGGAWPYANGSLHIGHIASLLPGDIIARYYRQKGEKVLYVSGSDCNGTPIAIRAKQENKLVSEIVNDYHEEFLSCFEKLGFTYDHYGRTDSEDHHQTVQKVFKELLNKEFIYKKVVKQTYCDACQQSLPDRYVEGTCPHCHHPARGDQCESCSKILDAADLLDKKCKNCGNEPSMKDSEQFYFTLKKFQPSLESYLEKAKENWRDNAIQLTERYLREGLVDRAASRDLSVGVPLPVDGYEDKKVYVWIEAVCGYLSASNQTKDGGLFWTEHTKTYYVHGKDNIPFHTIIWSAILLGIDKRPLPQSIISSEYVTLEKKKISTSRNWAIWVKDLLDRYHPDTVRYFLTINAPENRDADFSWREFIYSHNSELLGSYGNFINRTLKFIEKYFDGEIPNEKIDPVLKDQVVTLYDQVGELIEKGQLKKGIEEVFLLVKKANKYFDEREPWKTRTENIKECRQTLATCVHLIINFAQILSPFLPFSSQEIQRYFQIEEWKWEPLFIIWNGTIENVKPLFDRIDIKVIEEEKERLFNKNV
ncbi:methionine--tRNA ligase [Bacillus carboniphilus]|uniref:Methionine--tRNA ligase n=1 Tax=Bacillus carboniphilus TaxID=86663 RepID=A0ABY9JUD0_9BACI|nr:methionine--tRNA ligase [Bacillus carboniphilus]WLR42404.1 methionine--tRNA ligase [Bacillus carboniphilus]